MSEFIDDGRCDGTGAGITVRSWGRGATTFRGPHRLSYNSLSFFRTAWFPSPFNIWSARPMSSCFLPDFERPAKPRSDCSSDTRKLINICCENIKKSMLKFISICSLEKSQFFVFLSPVIQQFPPCWIFFFEKRRVSSFQSSHEFYAIAWRHKILISGK